MESGDRKKYDQRTGTRPNFKVALTLENLSESSGRLVRLQISGPPLPEFVVHWVCSRVGSLCLPA